MASATAAALAPCTTTGSLASTVAAAAAALAGVRLCDDTAIGFARIHAPSVQNGVWHLALSLSSSSLSTSSAEGLAPVRAISTQTFNVQAGALDASKCRASGEGIERAMVGQRASFVITPSDGRGYARKMARGAPFRLLILNSTPGGRRLADTQIDTRPDGSYLVNYTPYGAPGDFLLQVTFAARPICGSPFRVAVNENAPPARASRQQRPQTAPASRAMAATASLIAAAESVDARHTMLMALKGGRVASGAGGGAEAGARLLARLKQSRVPQRRQETHSVASAAAASAIQNEQLAAAATAARRVAAKRAATALEMERAGVAWREVARRPPQRQG